MTTQIAIGLIEPLIITFVLIGLISLMFTVAMVAERVKVFLWVKRLLVFSITLAIILSSVLGGLKASIVDTNKCACVEMNHE
jgi:hypothetical protein